MPDDKFGQIAPGLIAKDENVVQAFSLVENHLKKLFDSDQSEETSMITLKQFMAKDMANTLQSLSSSSSAADIGTALKNFSDKLKQI